MDKKPIHDYVSHTDYNSFLDSMTLQELENELSKTKGYLEYIETEFGVNRNLINNHIDDPEFEHIIDMAMRAAPTELDILTIKTKIKEIENKIAEKNQNR